MESLFNVLKVLLCIYLGVFTHLLYQLLFYHQKRFLFLKTLLFFGIIAVLMIHMANKFHILLFHMYLLFYGLGLYLSKRYLASSVLKKNKAFQAFLKPLEKKLFSILIKLSLPPFYSEIKAKIKTYRYYRKYPYLKPKTIYELF